MCESNQLIIGILPSERVTDVGLFSETTDVNRLLFFLGNKDFPCIWKVKPIVFFVKIFHNF